MRLNFLRSGDENERRIDNVVTWMRSIFTYSCSDTTPIGYQHNWKDLRYTFSIWHVRVTFLRRYDWTEDLLTENSVQIENWVFFQCILSDSSFTSLHECGFIQETKQYKWNEETGESVTFTRQDGRGKKECGPLLDLESSTLSNVWNDTERELWSCEFHLYFCMSPSIQKEMKGDTSISTWLKSDCKESIKIQYMLIWNDVLFISVSA